MVAPPAAKLYEPLPLEAGTSGMHIKGLAYRGISEVARGHVPEGLAAVSGCFKSEALRTFCMQPFMAASWYDVLPIQSMVACVASLLQIPFETFVREGARKQAGFDCGAVHKNWVTERQPGEAFLAHVQIGKRYYDFIDAGAKLVTPQEGHVWIEGMPLFLLPWFVPMQESYSAGVLTMAGAHKPRVMLSAQQAAGSQAGIPLARVEFFAQWT